MPASVRVWTPKAVRVLRGMWWHGASEMEVSKRLEPILGRRLSTIAVKSQANKISAKRGPDALSHSMRLARLGLSSSKEPKPITKLRSRDPVRKMVLVLPPPIKETKIRKPMPYLGLATSGPDPFREQKLAQARMGSRGRLD